MENLIGNRQHAYRRGQSTCTALIQMFDTITRLCDNQHNTGLAVLSLDFTKAFDKVNHQLLLKKLSHEVPKGFLVWLSSYLTGRNFRVKVQGQLSKQHLVNQGVPQGSVLGPALFAMLVGDLANNGKSDNNEFIQYADDVNIIIPLKSNESSEVN